ncbi:MAG: hypothetical protein JO215_06460 [Ktedonobacteraceae bacterium]|nr:hypothetical protein [Ktedonobacteraceae bacterium]
MKAMGVNHPALPHDDLSWAFGSLRGIGWARTNGSPQLLRKLKSTSFA